VVRVRPGLGSALAVLVLGPCGAVAGSPAAADAQERFDTAEDQWVAFRVEVGDGAAALSFEATWSVQDERSNALGLWAVEPGGGPNWVILFGGTSDDGVLVRAADPAGTVVDTRAEHRLSGWGGWVSMRYDWPAPGTYLFVGVAVTDGDHAATFFLNATGPVTLARTTGSSVFLHREDEFASTATVLAGPVSVVAQGRVGEAAGGRMFALFAAFAGAGPFGYDGPDGAHDDVLRGVQPYVLIDGGPPGGYTFRLDATATLRTVLAVGADVQLP
jgi:hypothetical protein